MKRHNEKRYSSGKPNPGEKKAYKLKRDYNEPEDYKTDRTVLTSSLIFLIAGIVGLAYLVYLCVK